MTVAHCLLWTDALRSAIVGYSLHADPPPDGRVSVSWNGTPLVSDGGPYLVECLPGEPRASAGAFVERSPGWPRASVGSFYAGLPALTVVDPPGVLSALAHLPWPEVVERSQGCWDPSTRRGLLRKEPEPSHWPMSTAEKYVTTGYPETVRAIRRIHGGYVVRVNSTARPWLGGENGVKAAEVVFLARRTPEELLGELQVAQVMES